MLVLVQDGLVDADALAPLRAGARGTLLTSPPKTKDAVDDGWIGSEADGNKNLRDSLQDLLLPRPQLNRIALAWQAVDERLSEVVRLVVNQADTYAISLACVIAGPLEENSDLEITISSAPEAQARVTPTVWYVGNEDTDHDPVSPARRKRALTDLLQVLLALDDLAADDLGLFEASGSHRPFCTFGIRFWGFPVSDSRIRIRELALEMLEEELFRLSDDGADHERDLPEAAESLLNRLGALNTPMSSSRDGRSLRFSDRVSSPPPNPFSDWSCPLTRRAARDSGERVIDHHKHEIRDYRETLLRDLMRLSSEIRKHGHEVYRQTRDDLRGFVGRSSTLAHLAILLRSYFPAFSKLLSRRFTRAKSPCEPAGSPSWNDCRRRFVVDAKSQLATGSNGLPTMTTLLLSECGAVLLAVLSALLLWNDVGVRLGLLPGVGGLVIGAGLPIIAKLRARKIARDLQAYFEEAASWLRESVTRKLEWVIGKTQASLEMQVIADALALDRRLRRNLDEFCDRWTDITTGAPESSPHDRSLPGLDEEDVREIKDRLSGLYKLIVAAVLDESDRPQQSGHIRRALDDLSALAHRRASTKPVKHSAVEREVLECAQGRIRPALLARLDDEVLQRGVLKTFVVPSAYPADWERKLREAASAILDVKTCRGQVSGPLAWIACRRLDKPEVRASLESTRVKP